MREAGIIRGFASIALLVVLVVCTGCATFPNGELPVISPSPPAEPGRGEHSVGSLVFDIDARRSSTSGVFVEGVCDFIFGSWVEAGYLADARLVRNRGFTGGADYEFVIDGRLRGTRAIGMQVVALVSLGLFPTFYDQHAYIEIEMTRLSDGASFEASASDGYRLVGWLPFLVTFWREGEGREDTYRRIGRHLYASLREQGAFDPRPARVEGSP